MKKVIKLDSNFKEAEDLADKEGGSGTAEGQMQNYDDIDSSQAGKETSKQAPLPQLR